MCGRLPLALRIAGQLLAAHPAWPVARLAGMLAEEQDRLARLGAGDLQVRAAFEVSYRQLADADARLFRLLGLHPGADFDVPAAAALAGTEPEMTGPVLDRLAEAHLVTEEATGRFGMHDLLRLFALPLASRPTTRPPGCRRGPPGQPTTPTWPGSWMSAWTRSCARAVQAAVKRRMQFPSMREALELFQAERPTLMAVVSLAAQRGWDEQVGQLTRAWGTREALRYLDDLLTIGRPRLPPPAAPEILAPKAER